MDLSRYDAFVRTHFDPADGDPRRLDLLRGPVSLASLRAADECLRANPNLATASGSGAALELEGTAVAELAALVFSHPAKAAGLFTSGGTTSNLYGAKIGLERAIPDAIRRGFQGRRPVGVCSEAAHFSCRTVAAWLGLGSDNLHAIPTDPACAMRLDLLEAKLDGCYRRGETVAFAVGTFGTTCAGGIDDLAGMRRVLDAKAKEYRQPRPHLHADAAIGWALCWLNDYDAAANPLGFDPSILPVLRRLPMLCEGLNHADSVTIDFHKLGRAPYPSSAFIVKDRSDLELLARAPGDMPYFDEPDAPARWTLETTRSGFGAYTAVANLRAFTRADWQMLIGRSVELAEHFKRRLLEVARCTVMNRDAVGPSVVFQVARPFAPARFRLGVTSDLGHGRQPAWVAHFLHPQTNESMMDELVGEIRSLA